MLNHKPDTKKYYKLRTPFIASCLSLSLGLALQAPALHAMELVPTIEDAIIHSPEYREQLKAHQGVQGELEGAEGRWYPTVDVEAGIGIEETERPGEPRSSLTHCCLT